MTPTRVMILGATGDLTGRYLLPALAELLDAGCMPSDVEIVGVARDAWDDHRFRTHALERLERHAPALSRAARHGLAERLSYVAGDVTDAQTVLEAAAGTTGAVVAYLALPPKVFAPAISALTEAGLGPGSRVVVEKPFGTDLASARRLNSVLHRHFPESTVFRMDHFLGKQTVQNILGLRFANRLFAPLWCSSHIERVDIVWDETVALEGRAGYYDEAGALRDMVQNHLLQVLCLVAMERPAGLGEAPLRDAKWRCCARYGGSTPKRLPVTPCEAGTPPATWRVARFPITRQSPASILDVDRDIRGGNAFCGQRPVGRCAVPAPHRQGADPRPPRDTGSSR